MKLEILKLLMIFAALCGPASSLATPAATARDALSVADLTAAPQRAVTVARLDAPVAEVWAYLSNHENLPDYSGGTVQDVTIDRSAATERDGVGTRRTCVAGKDRFVEEIVYFEAPYVFAYSVGANSWGLKDHLAIVSLTPDGKGSTLVRWEMFFNHQAPQMAPKMAANMLGMLRGRILPTLTKKYGGQVL